MAYKGQPVPSTTYQKGYFKVSDGKSVEVSVPANSDLKAGQFAYLDGFLGVITRDVKTAANEKAKAILIIEVAEYETDQIDDSKTFAKGDKIYWDATNKRLTTDATDIFAGVVTAAKDTNNVIWFILRPWVVSAEVAAVAAAAQAAAEAAQGQVEDYLVGTHGEPVFEVSGEATDTARIVTVTLKDAAGNDVEQICAVRVWLSDVVGGGETAAAPANGFAAPGSGALGEILETITANKQFIMLTEIDEGASKFNLELDEQTANKTWYLNVEWQGYVYSSEAIELKAAE